MSFLLDILYIFLYNVCIGVVKREKVKYRGVQMGKYIRLITYISQIFLSMIIPIAVCFTIGYFIDKKLGTGYICIIMFFVGALAGGSAVYRLVRKEIHNDKKGDGHESGKGNSL